MHVEPTCRKKNQMINLKKKIIKIVQNLYKRCKYIISHCFLFDSREIVESITC
jgi:hypothetical protein